MVHCNISIYFDRDINILKEALDKDSINDSLYFKDNNKKYLKIRSILAIITEKIIRLIPLFMRPLNHTGLVKRECERAVVQEYSLSSYVSRAELEFNQFNLTPPIPYYQLQLGSYQRTALGELLLDQPNNEEVKSLAVKYLAKKYTLAELSLEERRVLDEVNLRATQAHLTNMLHVLNDPNSNVSHHAAKIATQPEGAFHYKNALIAEVLAKSLAYNDAINHSSILIPTDINGILKFVEYKIEKHYVGERLPFYTFIPILPPQENNQDYATAEEVKTYAQAWINIRGTEPLLKEDKEGVLESIAADVKDSEGVSALPIWQKSHELLTLLSKIQAQTGHKVNITGHSLGGTLAQSMAVIYNPFVDQTFAFNSPGVDKNIHNFSTQLDKKNCDKIVVFHCAGDMVSSASPKRVGQNFEIIATSSDKQQANDAFVKHSDMMLNIPHRQLKVDIKKDENNRMRRFSEWSRRTILSRVCSALVNANIFGWFQKRQELRDFSKAYLIHLQNLNEE